MAHAIPTPEALGQATRAARKQLGLTQPQLALAAGVGVRFVVELEAGKSTVRLATLLRVLHALGGQLQLDRLPEAPTPPDGARTPIPGRRRPQPGPVL
ncbi:helix-turn-helix transcriptional regulator [Ideonella livida]|uniref:Helix-turn-helix transcriptional regulator n=1 Tax=Ideonella livida TaxID=2707176 RepID=A0A7C9PHI0_9BURK|nr:helix-turn-helix transcriptional regulator [Ideonella livida]NDY92113.1 helix-turn-helix transcriptional regulator [Ideonella livida]